MRIPSLSFPPYPAIRLSLPFRRRVTRFLDALEPGVVRVATEGPGLDGSAICFRPECICLAILHLLMPIPRRATASAAELAALDALFKGFADPSRIRILNLLAVGELCVCDLVAVLGLPQPAVSRHLAYLRRTGLVRARRDLRYAYYRLADPTHRVHAALLHAVRTAFRGTPGLDRERQAATARARDRARACP